MTTFTTARIAELRALAEKATLGPWRQHLVDDTTIIDATGEFVASTFPEGGMDDDIDYATDTEQREHSAAFIAAARTELPAALDDIERLRAENERLREALAPFDRVLTDDNIANDSVISDILTVGDYRRARAALRGKEEA